MVAFVAKMQCWKHSMLLIRTVKLLSSTELVIYLTMTYKRMGIFLAAEIMLSPANGFRVNVSAFSESQRSKEIRKQRKSSLSSRLLFLRDFRLGFMLTGLRSHRSVRNSLPSPFESRLETGWRLKHEQTESCLGVNKEMELWCSQWPD